MARCLATVGVRRKSIGCRRVVAGAGLWALGSICGMLLLAERVAAQDSPAAADLEFFEAKIRPILVERCFECHGPGDEIEGDLRLTSRAHMLRGGGTGPAIVPGDPSASLMIQAIRYEGEYEMPPDTKLPAAEIEWLTEWVRRGAVWPEENLRTGNTQPAAFDWEQRRAEHWCWQAIQSPLPPPVQNLDWALDPLDQFVLSRLEQEQIKPAADADRAAWLRRVSLDLTGLPPKWVELQEFLEDDSPQAYARVVDRLLGSPRFGERWARRWMDLIRYAETYGHEFDYPIGHAYEYRDYLIRAFNQDVPYDQFIREQVAGDLIATPRRHPESGINESLIGTGFWGFGEATHSPVDVRADQAIRIDNQIDVFSKTFLGLTVSCARCHEHKFDAISTADYYALTGFLQSSGTALGMLDPGQQIETAYQRSEPLAAEAIARLRPAVEASLGVADRQAAFLAAVEFLRQFPIPADASSRENWLNHCRSFRQSAMTPQRFAALVNEIAAARDESHPYFLLRRVAEQVELEVNEAFSLARNEFDANSHRGSAELEETELLFSYTHRQPLWLTSGWAFGNGPLPALQTSETGAWLPSGIASSRRFGNSFQGILRTPTWTLEHPCLHIQYRGRECQVRLVVDGYFMDSFNALLFSGFTQTVPTRDEFGWLTIAGDLKNYQGHRAHLEFVDLGNGYLDIAQVRAAKKLSPLTPGRAELAEISRRSSDFSSLVEAISIAESELFDRAQTGSLEAATWGEILSRVELLAHEIPEESSAGHTVKQSDFGRAEWDAYAESLRDWRKVSQSIPGPRYCPSIADLSAENGFLQIRGNPRLLGPQIPRRNLMALTGDNSQSFADLPGSGRLQLAEQIATGTNPLTARVIVNRLWQALLGRGIVASVDNFGVLGEPPTHPELLDYLASELIRDGWSLKRALRRICLSRTYRLSSLPQEDSQRRDPTGRLFHSFAIRRMEGEVIRDSILAISGQLDETMYGPSIPVHLNEFMQGRGRPAQSGPLDGARRRSIYQEIRRNFLSPWMLAFDTPAPFSTVGRRNSSNVPGQALILLNDPFVAAQAAHWAERILSQPGSTADRIRQMYLTAIAREPTLAETQRCLVFLTNSNEMTSHQSWAHLAHVLLNLKEFLFVH